jgi:hypothetical protein
MARKVLLRSSLELTKTLSAQMMGVAAEPPGSVADHFTFCVFENSVGRFLAVDEPL